MIKRQGYSPCFFMEMASKFLLRINDITEKLLQNAAEWRSFELHSMLQCRDIELETHPSMWALNRVHTCAYFSIAISALEQAMRLKQAPFYSF